MSKIKESSTHYENKQSLSMECKEIYAINLIRGQWTLAICCHLINGKLRFSELKMLLPSITERMLTLNLRTMEKDQLVKRTVYAEVPVRVEYELTEIGYQLQPIIRQLEKWGDLHKEGMREKK